MSRKITNIILTAMLVTGVFLLSYPSVANYWNEMHQARAIMTYTEQVSSMSKDDYSEIMERAREYNKRLAARGFRAGLTDAEKADYESQLAVDGSGIMGYISIPKFHIKYPVHHGMDEEVLQSAIGHIEYTSLPVGGESTHTQISGHRGLPSAKLFTDLDKLREGDTWTITVLNETFTYECDQIRIVEPTDLEELQLIEGEDLCTLITCTPYGVNSHRLLVRGHRVPNANGSADLTADAVQIEPKFVALFLMVPVLTLLFLAVMFRTRRKIRQ